MENTKNEQQCTIHDVMNNNIEYRTIRDMRFELRMSGIDNMQNFNDTQVVELFNSTFASNKKYIGIDINGVNIDYCS